MMIPQDPGSPGEATPITDDVIGIMSNGVLLDNHDETWSYDSCNGHSDQKDQYHYHIPPICFLKSMGVAVPNSSKWWIDDNGDEVRSYDTMAAQFPESGSSPVVGFARDGFPIYAIYDADKQVQRSDLDECNGKEESNGSYGYYITADPPFVPKCLRGNIGSFSSAPTGKACPKSGITSVLQGDVAAEEGESSGALTTLPYLSSLVSIAMAAVTFFI